MSVEEMFLREYEQLCQKYKMGLQGCGCCGSPYLSNNQDISEINYNRKLNKVFINDNGFWHEEELEGKIKSYTEKLSLEAEKTIDEYFEEVH